MASELRLLFSKDADGTVSVRLEPVNLDGPRKPRARVLEFALGEEDNQDLRWYLEEYMDLPDYGSRVRALGIEERIDNWGQRLFQEVFGSGSQQKLMDALLAADQPKLLTIATDDAAVLQLPWEMLTNSTGPLFRQLIVRRQLADAREAKAVQVELPLRILLVVSRPDDLGFIDPRMTTRGLLKALRPLGVGNVVVDFCRPATLARLTTMLDDARADGKPYAIVHFDGHGTYDRVLHLGRLCFEQADAGTGPVGTDPVTATRLGDLLAAYDIPLVILEACRSGQADVQALRGVAPRLLDAGVGSVIAMSHAVHVEAARVLLERVYRELVKGRTIGQSLDLGRASLVAQPHRWIELGPGGRTVELHDWFLPQLYQRGHDTPLVPEGVRVKGQESTGSASAASPDSAHSTSDTPFDVFLSHNGADKQRVTDIATRLRDEHGLRVWLDAWEMPTAPIQLALEQGVAASRYVVLFLTKAALESDWVELERQMAFAKDTLGRNQIPVLLDDVELPLGLKMLPWYDLRDAAEEDSVAAKIAAAVGVSREAAAAAAGGQQRRRLPDRDEPGAFPRPPLHNFQGRAKELFELQRIFATERGVLLHAMGGMGKTSLAREAAEWWTQTGLFPDGAIFISFETGGTAEHVAVVLGTYLEGQNFASLPQKEQLRQARELFQTRRVLVVWDNFESMLPAWREPSAPGAGNETTPGSADATKAGPDASAFGSLKDLQSLFADWTSDPDTAGRLLVTCRPGDNTGLDGARKYELPGLARPDSLHLLDRVMRKSGAAPDKPVDRDGLDRLAEVVSDHPLSLELTGAHLVTKTADEIIERFDELLEDLTSDDADVARNRSLLASLRFSTDCLSPAAQTALPWLGLFDRGVFEQLFLNVSEIDPESWASIRGELEATALIRVQDDIRIGDRPYLRFHPTLPYATRQWRKLPACEKSAGATPDVPADSNDGKLEAYPTATVRERFIATYNALDGGLDQTLRGENARTGMSVLSREEPNFRQAVAWAVESSQFGIAQPMGDTFRLYLERGFRLRERDVWVAWLAQAAAEAPWSAAVADQEMETAWSLLTQGQAREALQRLEQLIARLEQTTEFDPAFQLALTRQRLGRAYNSTGQAGRAIPLLRATVQDWEARCRIELEKTGWQSSPPSTRRIPTNLATENADFDAAFITDLLQNESHRDACRSQLANLSGTLGDLANALRHAGQFAPALAAARQAADIDVAIGQHRNHATELGIAAQILVQQGRYDEADVEYDRALAAARRAGDTELQGATLQHQGSLADDRRQFSRAADLYQQALNLLQAAGHVVGVMQTCNLLGVVEQKQGRLAEARAWYERSREIAREREDSQSLGAAAQNLGIVSQQEGEAARVSADEAAARRHFTAAERYFLESLKEWVATDAGPNEAMAQDQLGTLYRLMGRLDEAEQHAQRACEIREGLGDLRGLSITYQTLKHIAEARGEAAAAEQWAEKEREVDAELERRAHGGGEADGSQQVLQLLGQLLVGCVQSAATGMALPPQLAGLLDQLDDPDAGDLAPLGAWFRLLSTTPESDLLRQLNSPPPDLPEPLAAVVEQLKDALG